MAVKRTFTVTPTGVGRKDYSQNVEVSVEPVIRSHLSRINWWAEWPYWTPPYPYTWDLILPFFNKAGAVLDYVPEDIIYHIYDIYLYGKYNALTPAILRKYSYPDYIFLEEVAAIYGYGGAHLWISRGYKCEVGRVYTVSGTQWSEKPTFTIDLLVHGMTDLPAELIP